MKWIQGIIGLIFKIYIALVFSITLLLFYQDNDYLINDWEQLATIRTQKYTLDYYFRFDDPLSYIYLTPLMALAVTIPSTPKTSPTLMKATLLRSKSISPFR